MAQTPKAVALLSGGLDSSVATWLAAQTHTIALALTFDYGQRAAAQELAHARGLADRMGVAHRSLSLPWFKDFQSGGALLGQTAVPEAPALDDIDQSRETARAVWIPNRNGVFLEIAAGFAEDLGAESVVVGFNREEAATFPDNSEDYLHALNRALGFSSPGVTVVSPTAPLDKTEIVQAGLKAGFPLQYVWSCYEGGSQMCGRCESCGRLHRALPPTSEVSFENPPS